MYGKPEHGWQVAETNFGDCHIEFNTGTGEIIISNNGWLGWDCETFRALYLEMERKGMYDG